MKKYLLRIVGRTAFWLGWPMLYLYLRGSTRTRVVIIAEGSVLLGQGWLGDGRWELPGGGVHAGEDVVAGALREVHEETGINLQADQLKPIAGFKTKTRGLPFTCRSFLVRLDTKPAVTSQKGEISVHQWLRPEEVGMHNVEPASWRAMSSLTGQGLL